MKITATLIKRIHPGMYLIRKELNSSASSLEHRCSKDEPLRSPLIKLSLLSPTVICIPWQLAIRPTILLLRSGVLQGLIMEPLCFQIYLPSRPLLKLSFILGFKKQTNKQIYNIYTGEFLSLVDRSLSS